MSFLVSFRLLLDAAGEGLGEVGAGLVGDAEQHPEDVGYLFVQIVLFTAFERLVAVLAGHDAGQLAHFFGQYGHIGQFAEVAHAVRPDPVVHLFLCFFQCHVDMFWGLFLILGVDADGDGAVVEQLHLHVGAEFSRTHFLAQGRREVLAEALVQGDGDLVPGGTDVRWAVSFLGRGVQGELADDQNVASRVEDGAVHYAVFIVKDAEVHDFLAEPVDVFLSVCFLDAYQYQQTPSDGRLAMSVDGHRCVCGALYHYSHVLVS